MHSALPAGNNWFQNGVTAVHFNIIFLISALLGFNFAFAAGSGTESQTLERLHCALILAPNEVQTPQNNPPPISPVELVAPSLEFLRQDARDVRAQSGALPPRPLDPEAHALAAQTWDPRPGPALINAMMPEGVGLYANSLIAPATEDDVKTNGGSYVSTRVKWNFRGRDIGATVGTRVHALVDNLGKPIEQRSLVSDDAKAVVLHFGGGGTITTGPHAGKDIQEYFSQYGIDVVTIENPDHGFGPLGLRSAKETMEAYLEFIKKYLSIAGRPIFISGHSMGGEMTDAFMRLFPKSKLAQDPLTALIKGVLPLSTIPQLVPGANPVDNLHATAQIYSAFEDPNSGVAEFDRDLVKGIYSNNKLSLTGNAFEALFSSTNNWDPNPNAADYLPALYIWGGGDFLIAGRIAEVRERLKNTPNARVLIYEDDSWDMVDHKFLKVGHQIFDHFRPGTRERQTFHDIINFMSEILGTELPRVASRNEGQGAVLRSMTQLYTNVFPFRSFLNHQVISNSVANDPDLMKNLTHEIMVAQSLRTSLKAEAGDTGAKKQLQRINQEYLEAGRAFRAQLISSLGIESLSQPDQDNAIISHLDPIISQLESLRKNGYQVPADDVAGQALLAERSHLETQIKALDKATVEVRSTSNPEVVDNKPIRAYLNQVQTALRRSAAAFASNTNVEGLSDHANEIHFLNVSEAILMRMGIADFNASKDPEIRAIRGFYAQVERNIEIMEKDLSEVQYLDLLSKIEAMRIQLQRSMRNVELTAANAALAVRRLEVNRLLDNITNLATQIDQDVTNHFIAYFGRTNGVLIENDPPGLPPNFVELARTYGAAQEVYQRAKSNYEVEKFNLALSGGLGAELERMAKEVNQGTELSARISREVLVNDQAMQAAENRLVLVQTELVERYSNGMYRMQTERAIDLFESPDFVPSGSLTPDERTDLRKRFDQAANKVWKAWRSIWSDRTQEAGRTALY